MSTLKVILIDLCAGHCGMSLSADMLKVTRVQVYPQPLVLLYNFFQREVATRLHDLEGRAFRGQLLCSESSQESN